LLLQVDVVVGVVVVDVEVLVEVEVEVDVDVAEGIIFFKSNDYLLFSINILKQFLHFLISRFII